MALGGSRLELDGVDVRQQRRVEILQTSTGAEDTSLIGSVGALYELSDRVDLGFQARKGARWNVARQSFIASQGILLDPGSRYTLRAPDAYSLGASYRPRRRRLVSGQLDYVRYSQIRSVLAVRQGDVAPQEYALDDGWEARLGVEWTRPFRPFDLQLRGGVYSQAPGSLTYIGPDPVERATFAGSDRRLLGAVGASIAAKRGVGLDTASSSAATVACSSPALARASDGGGWPALGRPARPPRQRPTLTPRRSRARSISR